MRNLHLMILPTVSYRKLTVHDVLDAVNANDSEFEECQDENDEDEDHDFIPQNDDDESDISDANNNDEIVDQNDIDSDDAPLATLAQGSNIQKKQQQKSF